MTTPPGWTPTSWAVVEAQIARHARDGVVDVEAFNAESRRNVERVQRAPVQRSIVWCETCALYREPRDAKPPRMTRPRAGDVVVSTRCRWCRRRVGDDRQLELFVVHVKKSGST